MLVPVTGSMYVRGETAQMQTLLVDVGTGYLIEKSPDEAQARPLLAPLVGIDCRSALYAARPNMVCPWSLHPSSRVGSRG
jgi:hypothetical protein